MKPISPERRAEIVRLLEDRTTLAITKPCIQELLDAEAFWRTRIAETKPLLAEYGVCVFCAHIDDEAQDGQPVDHKPDCPWVLAHNPKP
jgi:hypothetical protein